MVRWFPVLLLVGCAGSQKTQPVPRAEVAPASESLLIRVHTAATASGLANAPELLILNKQLQGAFAMHSPASWAVESAATPDTATQSIELDRPSYFVQSTLTVLTQTGQTTSCKLSGQLAHYPSKSMFGFINAQASAEGGGVEAATECTSLAMSDLAKRSVQILSERQARPTRAESVKVKSSATDPAKQTKDVTAPDAASEDAPPAFCWEEYESDCPVWGTPGVP